MPATCTQSPSTQAIESANGVTTVSTGAGNVGTWVIRAKVNTLPADANKIAYLWAEQGSNVDLGDTGNERVALFVRGDGKLYFEWWDGANARITPGVSISTGQFYYVHCERNGNVISMWVGDPYSTTPSATLSGVGTTNFDGTADYIVLFRAATNLNLLGTGGINGVERFKGSLAFFAGYRAVFTQDQRVRLYAGGVPKRDDLLLDGELTPTYSYTLESLYPETRGGAILQLNGVALPTFTQTREVSGWENADPFSLDPAMFDDVTSCRAFWTFQEAAAGASSEFVDRINGIALVYAGDSAFTGAGGNANNLARVEDGVFGRYCLNLGTTGVSGTPGDSVPLWVPSNVPGIDLLRMPGRKGVTVQAWIKPASTWAFDKQMGIIGGVWGEQGGSDGDRQYALFIGLRSLADEADHPPSFTVNGHTSVNGDNTPPYSFNYEVGWSGERWKKNRWLHCAMTFDAEAGETRCYLNGRLTPSARNPYSPGYNDLYESEDGFRVGGVIVSGGTVWGNWANCYIGGLAVFEGAMSAAEIAASYAGAGVAAAAASQSSPINRGPLFIR